MEQHGTGEGVFTLGDARSFSGLTSKIPPLDSMLNFDADVKKTTARHQCENRLTLLTELRPAPVEQHGTDTHGTASCPSGAALDRYSRNCVLPQWSSTGQRYSRNCVLPQWSSTGQVLTELRPAPVEQHRTDTHGTASCPSRRASQRSGSISHALCTISY